MICDFLLWREQQVVVTGELQVNASQTALDYYELLGISL